MKLTLIKNTSIRGKINFLLFSISALFLGAMSIVGWSYYEMWSNYQTVDANRRLQIQIERIRKSVDQARVIEAQFLNVKKDKLRDEFEELLNKSLEEVSQLAEEKQTPEMLAKVLAVEEVLDSYQMGFDKVSSLYKNVGYSLNEGYRGRLKKNSDEINQEIAKLKDRDIDWNWLQVQLLEKNYFQMLGPGQINVKNQLKGELQNLKKKLTKKLGRKNDIVKPAGLLDGYISNFDRVRFYETEVKDTKQKFDIEMAALPKLLNSLEEEHRAQENQIFTSVSVMLTRLIWLLGAIFLGVLGYLFHISRWVGGEISKPLASITEASVAMALGVLNKPLDFDRDDEIGHLANNFNLMQASVKEKIQSLEILNSLSEKMVGLNKNRKILELSLETLANKFGHKFKVNFGFAYLYNSKGQLRIKGKIEGGLSSRLPVTMEEPNGFLADVLKSDQAVVFDADYAHHEEFYFLKDQVVVALPILVQGDSIGVLSLVLDAKEFVLDSELKFLVNTLGRIISANLQNTQMMKQITKHNKNLETTVKARTRDVMELLDNAGQGFLVFKKDYTVMPSYSKVCFKLLNGHLTEGTTELAGLKITELLFKQSEREMFTEFLNLIFDDYKKNSNGFHFLPTELNVGDKILESRFQPLVDESGELKVMVILSDITKEKRLAHEKLVKEENNKLLIQVVSDKTGAQIFLREMAKLFGWLKEGTEIRFNQALVMRSLHTMKGNSAGFGFIQVSQMAHNIESSIQENNDFGDTALVQLRADINVLHEKFDAKVEELTELIPEFLKESDKLEITPKKMELFQMSLLSKVAEEHKEKIKEEFKSLLHQPLSKLLKGYPRMIQDVADSLGKEIEFSIHGEVEADLDSFTSVFSNLGHLVKNAIDHGIEDYDERIKKGKNEIGKLQIYISEKSKRLHLKIADDGSGIDPERIRHSAVEKGILTEQSAKNLSEKEILPLIFHSGFSTKESVSSISGRGVGMDAVKMAVEECGGTIEINSILGQGTNFEIQLPLGA
ncbi:MAG: ATP-binding protein [SAR324 cluster bacterium]|nr:ATP-binding protein [SAR324 cluster bacterium]